MVLAYGAKRAQRCTGLARDPSPGAPEGFMDQGRLSPTRPAFAARGFHVKGFDMSKGDKQRGNREVKKPKQVKAKPSAVPPGVAGKFPPGPTGGKKSR